MPRRRDGRFTLDNFIGGINERDDPIDMPVNEARFARNFVPYGQGGAIIARDGDLLVSDLAADSQIFTPGAVTVPLKRIWISPTQGVLVTTGSNKIVKSDGTDVYDSGGLAAGSIGLGDSWFMEAPASGGQGPVYFRDLSSGGANVYRQWTGAGLSAAWTAAVGTLPTAKWFLYVGNRVWAFGIPPNVVITAAEDSRVGWSELGDPRNWPAANTLQLAPGDGEQFTGGGRTGEVLILFKSDKAWVIYDLDTGANRPLGEDVGAREMDTICTTPIGLFFIDPSRGPMLTDGASTRVLKNGLKARWEDFETAIYANEHIYCTAGALTYDYDIRTESWWIHDIESNFLYQHPISGLIYSSRGTTLQAHLDQVLVPGEVDSVDGFQLGPEWRSVPLSFGGRERKRLTKLTLRGDGGATIVLSADLPLALTMGGISKTLESGLAEWSTLGVVRLPTVHITGSGGGVDPVRLDELTIDYTVRSK